MYKVKHTIVSALYLFAPLVGFTKNMHKYQVWQVDVQFHQGRLKVKVIVQGWTLYDLFRCPLYKWWQVGYILKGFSTDEQLQ